MAKVTLRCESRRAASFLVSPSQITFHRGEKVTSGIELYGGPLRSPCALKSAVGRDSPTA